MEFVSRTKNLISIITPSFVFPLAGFALVARKEGVREKVVWQLSGFPCFISLDQDL